MIMFLQVSANYRLVMTEIYITRHEENRLKSDETSKR